MRAREVLKRYAAGDRDFRRVSLRGQSFKGKNLSGADFSEANIRGTNFAKATLVDVSFRKAKAGHQWYSTAYWLVFAVILIIYSLILGLPGFSRLTRLFSNLPNQPILFLSNVIAALLPFLTVAWLGSLLFDRKAVDKKIIAQITAVGGTSFRGANLAKADFSEAKLPRTDFTNAILTRANWENAKGLDITISEGTYLVNAKVQELLITRNGQDKDFNRLNLQGVNLQGANLIGASFIEANLNEANLQDADLTDAKLVHAQLDRADLTGATLTGAYIQEWNITTETKLNGIRCKYVNMRLPPDKRPAFLALPPEESRDSNPRRKPDDWNKNFEEGEFSDFIEPMRLTLDLYHNQTVDPRLVAFAFGQLKDDNPDAELEAIAFEKRGKHQDKLLMKVQTAPHADHSTLNSEYFYNLEYLKSLSPEALRALLVDKDRMIQRFTAILEVRQKTPDVTTNINNARTQGGQTVTGDNVTHVGRDYRETIFQGQTNYSEGDFYNYSTEDRQTLADAANEIQELLEQLDSTYSTDTAAGQMQAAQEAMRRIEGDRSIGDRLLSALRVGGTEALKQTLNHPAATFILALLEDWQKTKGS